jgi:hypothetical protein
MINDIEGNDMTSYYLENPDFQFLIVTYDLHTASQKGLARVNNLAGKILDNGYSAIVLTSSIMDEIEEFRKQYHPDLEYFNADDIELKTMIRANPGMILLKDGVVIDKWAWRDLPDYEELVQEHFGE